MTLTPATYAAGNALRTPHQQNNGVPAVAAPIERHQQEDLAMPNTERLYAQLDEVEAQIDAIKRGGVTLYRAINELVLAYARDHDCDATGTMEHIDDAISDLVNDAEGPAWRRKCRLENDIGAIEDADLRLSGPVTL